MSVTTEKKKFDGSLIRVAECTVGDATGVVTLIVRNGKTLLHAINVVCCFRVDRRREGSFNDHSDERLG